MDELPPSVELEAGMYRCPGEARSIDRAVHLARLAAFYPPCRQCAHRGDARLLSPLTVRQWAEIERRASGRVVFSSEALEGSSPNDVDPRVVARFAAAVAIVLWRRNADERQPPAVLIGSDGHWTTAELVAAACEALRLAGCRAVETGATTSASLAASARHVRADAALWIGNAQGAPHSIALKLWGPSGRPWSSPGELDAVREVYESAHAARPKRRGGSLQRAGGDATYLSPLASLFHGLRPLRLVLDTTCEPLVRYWHVLGAQSACEMLRTQGAQPAGAPHDAGKSFVERRLARLGERVRESQAHFGLWIDGEGESCRVVDERGYPIDADQMFLILAAYICRQQPAATLALDGQASSRLAGALASWKVRVVHSEATRQAMYDCMRAENAVFGRAAGGRFWYAGDPSAPDALLTLSLLLTILSQSDRALSEVLDEAQRPVYK